MACARWNKQAHCAARRMDASRRWIWSSRASLCCRSALSSAPTPAVAACMQQHLVKWAVQTLAFNVKACLHRDTSYPVWQEAKDSGLGLCLGPDDADGFHGSTAKRGPKSPTP